MRAHSAKANEASPKWISCLILEYISSEAFVWTLIKPGVDAWRVINDSKRKKDTIIGPQAELSLMRVIELVTESIPGCVIQIGAMLQTGGDRSLAPLLALASSILAAAFVSVQLSHDWDTDENHKKSAPSFYGFLPRSIRGRIVSLTYLLVMSMCSLIIRSMTCTILARNGVAHVIFVLLGGERASRESTLGLRRSPTQFLISSLL